MVQLQAVLGEFCLGEVIVTYASARVDGSDGWACVSGWDDEAAMAAALCDALADARVDGLARQSLDQESADRSHQAQAVAATRLELV
jgi:alpha-D-ribose 1-methylphosphonate 5-triphosphate synthase subunit PhnG